MQRCTGECCGILRLGLGRCEENGGGASDLGVSGSRVGEGSVSRARHVGVGLGERWDDLIEGVKF